MKGFSIVNKIFIIVTDLFRPFLRRRQSLQETADLHRKDNGAI